MKRLALGLFVCVGLLLALGVVMVCSASTGGVHGERLWLQPIWCVIGLGGCLVAATVNYQWFKRYPVLAAMVYLIALGLLILVLVPQVGASVKGARRWLRFGGLGLQPSEFAKLAMVLAVAVYADLNQRSMGKFGRGLLLPGLLIGGLVAPVFLQPDVGTAVLMAGVGGVILLVAGVRWKHLAPCLLVVLVALVVYLTQNQVRSGRIHAWFHPEETKLGVGMQAYNSKLAMGSGGLTGVGLGDGRYKLGFLPEHDTDFILSVVGEELGLVATLLIVASFAGILICGIGIAHRARDLLGMLLASGVTFLISFQAIINIGVVTGCLPNKGLSLPFISYGGSNLVMLLTAVGVLVNVARQARQQADSGWASVAEPAGRG